MRRLLFFVFLSLSSTVFAQDSIINADTTPVYTDSSINHQIGAGAYPSPRKTLESTLLKGRLSMEISNAVIISVIAGFLLLLVILTIVVIRRRKLKKRG
jgi:hypothetical protein